MASAGTATVVEAPALAAASTLAEKEATVGEGTIALGETTTTIAEKGADVAEKTLVDFNAAVEEGITTSNHSTISVSDFSKGESPSLAYRGASNSSEDFLNIDGTVKQRRYYDSNGNALEDIDYNHGGEGHTFPHRHYWVGTGRFEK